VLDKFDHNSVGIKPHHQPKLQTVVRYVLGARAAGRPVRALRLVGHTDPSGSDAYNTTLGRKRAAAVAVALRQMLEDRRRGSTRGLTLIIESRGEQEPLSNDPAGSRRVQICLVGAQPTQPGRPNSGRIPPDRNVCSVPRRGVLGEIVLEAELEVEFGSESIGEFEAEQGGFEQERVAVAPLARVSLFQNGPLRSDRNHFLCGAGRQALRIGAVVASSPAASRPRVGATPYGTGAGIIQAIQNARTSARRPLDFVHIFSHSGPHGIAGTVTGGTVGLYTTGLDAASRAAGGRVIADIPAQLLANNVVFVLHGCSTAEGEQNFARALYTHLARSLTSPKVYGHFNSGCASRDNSWREYSRSAPGGRTLRNNPHYNSVGCCS
jgi:hypothetical protein